MPFLRMSAVALAGLLTLTGCSVFYPNWGATTFPEEPTSEPRPTETVTVTAEPEPTDIESEAPVEEPSEEPVQPSETPTEQIVQSEVEVTIIVANPDTDSGVLSVVAEVLNITENDGICSLSFIGSDQQYTNSVSGVAASDYTVCVFEEQLSEIPSGNGVVTVTYESPRYIGRSAASSVVIP